MLYMYLFYVVFLILINLFYCFTRYGITNSRDLMTLYTCTVNVLKFRTSGNNEAYTNSADPDQTASEEAVWSGSSIFVNSSPDNQHFI